MASTPPQPSQSQSLPIKSAARKLPVKRKTPDFDYPNPSPIPKIEAADEDDDEDLDDLGPPPFKFHRIWTESDEIRFLQGLLDCSSDGLIFPRDLHLFYHRFSESIPQPYTKSQLSEKLRRLRKKFRVISARIARGLDPSLLTPHDQSLFDLSNQLWNPSYASSSPFHANNKRKSTRVRVKVSFSPTLTPSPSTLPPPTHPMNDSHENFVNNDDDDHDVEINNRVNFESNFGAENEEESNLSSGGGLGRIAAKTVMDVFDRSLKEARIVLVRRGLLCPDHKYTTTPAGSSKQGKTDDLMKRWREQRVAELDVLARRLRLVLEHAIHDQ